MQNKTNVQENVIDHNTKLQEFTDSIENSILNVDTVIDEQTQLIDFINEYDKEKKFETLVSNLTEQVESYVAQKKDLSVKKNKLTNVLELLSSDLELKNVVYDLLDALGMGSK